MKYTAFLLIIILSCFIVWGQSKLAHADVLTPHQAIYNLTLSGKKSGAQIVSLNGSMFYEIKNNCDGWTTHHKFNMRYDYADTPSTFHHSDFTTFESFDGQFFNFSTRRYRNNDLYEEFRGAAQGGQALFSIPQDTKISLSSNVLYPVSHTRALIKKAKEGERFFTSKVFDGSDDEGVIYIHTHISSMEDLPRYKTPDIHEDLLPQKAWKVHMSVFPDKDDYELADYEISMVLYDTGIIDKMEIDYGTFKVSQFLSALQPITTNKQKNHTQTIECDRL